MNAMQKDTVNYILTGLFQMAIIVLVSWLFALAVTSINHPKPQVTEVECTVCSCATEKSINLSGLAL